jgi:anti-sigma factor RsiW
MNQCINPDEIQEGDWSAYLHGEASEEVVRHVARCAFCAEQIERMRMVDTRLLAAFYRDECPTPEILADYALGNLLAAEKLRVAAHVRSCMACREDLAPFRALAEEPPTLLRQLWESLALALVARPVSVAAVPVRGAGWQGRFEADDLIITLSSQDGRLAGRVRRRLAPTDASYHGQAWLLSRSMEEAQPIGGEVDDRGRIGFVKVAAGDYALLLKIGEHDTVVEEVQVV